MQVVVDELTICNVSLVPVHVLSHKVSIFIA